MRTLLAGLLLLVATTAWGQDKIYISGFVNDVTTLQPLSYVNISSKGRVIGSTDQLGFFKVTAFRNDTLIFTRLGYQPYFHVASENNWDERIFMNEMGKMLDEVTIYDRYQIHGKKEIDESTKKGVSPLNNFTMDPANQQRMVQTFGPGVSFGAPWNKWTKEAREKKHLQAILSENQRTAVYNEFIHSVVVEEYMQEQFSLDHETFMKRKEEFIVANPDARYLKARGDIIDLMVAFFAIQKP